MQKKFRLNEIHFLLRMRNLIVIRNILKILKKVSAAYSQKARALKIHFLLLLLLLNIINPALYMCYLFGCHSFVNSCYVFKKLANLFTVNLSKQRLCTIEFCLPFEITYAGNSKLIQTTYLYFVYFVNFKDL